MRRAALVGVALLASACGGRPAAMPAGGGSVQGFEHDLDVAEGRIHTAVASPPGAGQGESSPSSAGPPPAPAEAPAQPNTEADEQASSPAPEEESLTGCDAACRALSSMQRAADGICELAGESDARCTSARQRVGDAKALIEKSGCGCS